MFEHVVQLKKKRTLKINLMCLSFLSLTSQVSKHDARERVFWKSDTVGNV